MTPKKKKEEGEGSAQSLEIFMLYCNRREETKGEGGRET